MRIPMRLNALFLLIFVSQTFVASEKKDWTKELPTFDTEEEYLNYIFEKTEEFPEGRYPEVKRYAVSSNKIEATAEGSPPADLATWSKIAIDKGFINPDDGQQQFFEFNRSIQASYIAYLLAKGDREKFIKTQFTPDKKFIGLSEDKFTELRNVFLQDIPNLKVFNALIVTLINNDLGKIYSIQNDVKSVLGIETVDHDRVLAELYNVNAPEQLKAIVKSFNNKELVDSLRRSYIREFMRAGFSIGQFGQLENLPGNLTAFVALGQGAKKLAFWEAFFDVAGSQGHTKAVTDVPNVMNAFVVAAYLTIRDILYNNTDALTAYQTFLGKKASALGFPSANKFSNAQIALIRLATMARAKPEDFKGIESAFNELSNEDQQNLINELSKTGINDSGILLYYAPAVIQNAGVPNRTVAFKTLSTLFKTAREYLIQNDLNEDGVHVFNVRKVALAFKDALTSKDPKNLEKLKSLHPDQIIIVRKGDDFDVDIDLSKEVKPMEVLPTEVEPVLLQFNIDLSVIS